MGTTNTALRRTYGSSGAGAASVQVVNNVIENNSTNPTYQMDFSADFLTMPDANNENFCSFDSVSETFDITTDLDTGSEAGSTWYYLWLTSEDGGATVTRYVSTSDSVPSGISSSDCRIRVGSIYNDASSNFRSICKNGNRIEYKGDFTVVGNVAVSSWTSISLTAYVPPTSQRAWGIIAGSGGLGGACAVTGDSSRSRPTTAGTFQPVIGFGSSTSSIHVSLHYDVCMITTAQTIYYTGQSMSSLSVYIGGYYEDPGNT